MAPAGRRRSCSLPPPSSARLGGSRRGARPHRPRPGSPTGARHRGRGRPGRTVRPDPASKAGALPDPAPGCRRRSHLAVHDGAGMVCTHARTRTGRAGRPGPGSVRRPPATRGERRRVRTVISARTGTWPRSRCPKPRDGNGCAGARDPRPRTRGVGPIMPVVLHAGGGIGPEHFASASRDGCARRVSAPGAPRAHIDEPAERAAMTRPRRAGITPTRRVHGGGSPASRGTTGGDRRSPRITGRFGPHGRDGALVDPAA